MDSFMKSGKTRWGGRLFVLSGLLWGAGCDAPVEPPGGQALNQVGQAAASTYEAESATLSGGAVKATDHTGYSGTGFVGGFTDGNKGNAAVQFAVSAATSGTYTATLRYANGTGATMTLSLYVDGAKVSQVSLPPTANWDTWGTKTETLTNLSAGPHTVRYKFDSSDSGNVNVDTFSLEAQTTTPPPSGSGPLYEAESATLSGGAVIASDHPGYSGTGFVGGFTDGNKGKATAQFAIKVSSSATYEVALRYANGSGASQRLSLYVDGVKLLQTSLGTTANWDTWSTRTETLTGLTAGNHTLSYKYDTTDTGNVNLDSITVSDPITTQPPPPTGSGPLYEAESAALSGGVAIASDHPGYSGTGFVGGFTDGNKGKATAQFAIKVASSATYEVALRYANGSGVAQSLSLYVDGTRRLQTSLGITANWDTWGTRTETLTGLTAGNHTLSYKYDTTDSGNVNLDNITVSDPIVPPPAPPPRPAGQVYEAEEQFISGGVVKEDDYLRGFSSVGARTIFTVNSASNAAYSTSLLYLNSSSANKTLNVYVNGLYALTTTLPGTGSSAWGTKNETLNLRRGLNTITYQYDSANTGGALLDALVIPNALALAPRGATLPYQELEAEDGSTNAQTIGPGRQPGSPEAESSGRRAVKLTQTGQYVEWTVPQTANSLVVRYSMPDTASGSGINATLSLYVDGTRRQSLGLTSKYAWVYGGWPYANDPNTPSKTGPDGKPEWDPGAHRFYDESRFLLSSPIQAGSKIRLQRDSSDTAASYTIDLIDLELVDAALPMPANFVSITAFGATADDSSDDTQAILSAISSAKSTGKAGVWIPAGSFSINNTVELENIQLRGAGPWHTRINVTSLTGDHFKATGNNVQVFDLSYIGNVVERNDKYDRSAFEGNFGTGSLVQNVWIEHAKVGFWIQPPTNGLYVVGSRVRNVYADGTNIQASVIPNTGVKNTMFSHVHARNTGDDAFAIWSELGMNENCTFRYDTAQLPNLANGFAIYQGRDNKILDSVAEDTYYASSGVMISDWFGNEEYKLTFQGTTEVKRMTLNRTGGTQDTNFKMTAGALFILATRDRNIEGKIVVDGVDILDSTYSGIKLAYGKAGNYPLQVNNNYAISNVTLNNISIKGSGTYGLETQYVPGTATCTNVTVSGSAGLQNLNGKYTFSRLSGNSGW